jgi:tRNA (mo5U34)-methyltransferase
VVTPGFFDLRPVVELLPWPDVRGKRCLDVGTADGFFAFELERRGAAEVVAVDIARPEQWDLEPIHRPEGLVYVNHALGDNPSAGFEAAARLIGSSVRLVRSSVYELNPAEIGFFDVVVCGSVLLHLRDPLRALAAIRSVCTDRLLSTNQIELRLTLRHPRLPLHRIDGTSGVTQWWLPNLAGHRHMLFAAGFTVERESRLYSLPFGPAHPPIGNRWGSQIRRLGRRLLTGGDGVPHHAVGARVR